MAEQSYPKHEKLKSRKSIDALFTGGASVVAYPVRLVYRSEAFADGSLIKIGVSVSKKHFKKATDRNYLKRVLRECYRRNKSRLGLSDQSYAMMLLYQSKEMLPFSEIEALVQGCFDRFSAKQQPK